MWKKHELVMLPTNEKASTIWLNTNSQLLHTHVSGEYKEKYNAQHLYILSDKEIKEGDWFHDKILNVFVQADIFTDLEYVNNSDLVKKIIATTDKSLTKKEYPIINGQHSTIITDCYLPQIPQSFIEYFVKQYNKGIVIDKVMVEYYRRGLNSDGIDADLTGGVIIHKNDYYVPRINNDNTINIKPIKDSWSRKEVESLLHMVVNDSHCSINRVKQPNSNEYAGFVNKWIEKNL